MLSISYGRNINLILANFAEVRLIKIYKYIIQISSQLSTLILINFTMFILSIAIQV